MQRFVSVRASQNGGGGERFKGNEVEILRYAA